MREDVVQLFHLHTVMEEDDDRQTRTWLVIADNLFEAVSLVPEGYVPAEAEVRTGAVVGPGRVIGWMGMPSLAAIQSQAPLRHEECRH